MDSVQVAKKELALECDYSYEARSQKRFRELVMADTDFALHVRVPDVVSELCTPRLLTTEWVPGVHIDKASYVVLLAQQQVADLLFHPSREL